MTKDQPSQTPLTRRAALGALAAAAAGYAAFGPRAGRSLEARSGRIVLDYWEKWTRHEGDAMRTVVDAFNASQTRIFVRYLVTADIGQKSMVAIAGGDPPDVIGLYAFNVPPYAQSGALVRLDALAAQRGMSLEQYSPGVRPVMRQAGAWWAVVNTCGSVALYYNKALFREVGLDPSRPPRTIDELDEMHKRLVVGGLGAGAAAEPLKRVGFFHREPGWWSWFWGYHFGGKVYDAASDVATVGAPQNRAAFEWMQTYPRALGVDRATRLQDGFGNYFTPENPFLTGKVGMIVQGPWVANLVGAFKPDLDYGVAPFPVASGLVDAAAPIGLIDTDVLVIPRGAKHPEASMEFIAFTQRREMVELLAKAHCKPSPLLDQSEDFIRTHPNRGIAVHDAITRSERAFIPPPTRVWQQFKDEFDTQVQRMWRLEVEAGDALAALQPRAQALIDRAASERRRRAAGGVA
ncbi:MAG: ABC transporter substrate-binding protein [Phycisphaerales bacterium]